VPGTSFAPCSITRACAGRTNSASPSPQRISFGAGSAASADATFCASTSARRAPGTVRSTAYTKPFEVSKRVSSSGAKPCLRAKPATASGGALIGGPCTRSRVSAARSRTRVIDTAKRRGVAK
jgi:hypothetical protein